MTGATAHARQGPDGPPASRREGAAATATAADRKFDFRIAIIGAGFGGIAAAVYLTKAGFHNFTIFERTDGLGGVWHQSTYPGAEVDTASDWYSFRFKRYDWPKPHSAQPERISRLISMPFSAAGRSSRRRSCRTICSSPSVR